MVVDICGRIVKMFLKIHLLWILKIWSHHSRLQGYIKQLGLWSWYSTICQKCRAEVAITKLHIMSKIWDHNFFVTVFISVRGVDYHWMQWLIISLLYKIMSLFPHIFELFFSKKTLQKRRNFCQIILCYLSVSRNVLVWKKREMDGRVQQPLCKSQGVLQTPLLLHFFEFL